jgi:hypothetical protein
MSSAHTGHVHIDDVGVVGLLDVDRRHHRSGTGGQGDERVREEVLEEITQAGLELLEFGNRVGPARCHRALPRPVCRERSFASRSSHVSESAIMVGRDRVSDHHAKRAIQPWIQLSPGFSPRGWGFDPAGYTNVSPSPQTYSNPSMVEVDLRRG